MCSSDLDLSTLGSLEFLPPEPGRYPALALGYAALKMGESAPAVLSAANEEAVDAFLHRRISFPAISRVLEGVLSRHEPFGLSTLDDVTRAAAWARRTAREEIEQKF